MTPTTTIDLGHVVRDLGLPQEKVARTLELLDEGNTVPFITRYRKDHTGGLDEEQIREIQLRIGKIRQLAERKATILKTIEAQGQLTPELADQIEHANTPKRLEDLYLPFKPKKQTLATIARERGLEPLAIEIYEAWPSASLVQARAAAFVSSQKGVPTVEDVLAGVGHLIAERFSENPELRGRLRRIFQRSGRIVCTKVEAPVEAAASVQAAVPVEATAAPADGESGREGEGEIHESTITSQESTEAVAVVGDGEADSETTTVPSAEYSVPSTESVVAAETAPVDSPNSPVVEITTENPNSEVEKQSSPPDQPTSSPTPDSPAEATQETPVDTSSAGALPAGRLFNPAPPVSAPLATANLRKKKKKKKKVIGEHAFKDYYNYVEPLGRVPPHRVLAINRGERAHAIRVKVEADVDAMLREAEQFLIFPNHPHGEFIFACVRDSLLRLIIPSLEREIRREMTERAEEHAVDVFIRNLRRLLLQPPTRSRRVLAIDPGFKSGSKMAALDEFGNVLGHGMVFVIGKDEDRRKKARTRLADLVKQHQVSVIAIGNGTGCRETEQLVADCLVEELKEQDVAYVIVNEAGASIYSTSPLGREELPQYDALQRGAISIGRRLLDPLSEMVKIHPANLGVGLYQHDIKAKHLKDSLDAVVESCVNFVGVDVNSASPALLRYVSGMNALTARRVYEHRREKGPFKNREELKQVAGFGDQTFVQAAGFSKVIGGENPLDATWIHPESYDIAGRVLEKIGCDLAELAKSVPAPTKDEPKPEFAAELKQTEGGTGREGEGETGGQEISGIKTGDGGQETEVSSQEVQTGSQELPAEEVAELADENVTGTEYSVLSTAAESDSISDTTPATQSLPVADVSVPDSTTTDVTADSGAALPASPTPPRPPSPTLEQTADAPPPASPEPSPTPRSQIAERTANVDVPQLAAELNVGTHLLQDILTSLTRPGIDPRDNLPPPMFRRGIIKLEDLAQGMELSGTVLNVVDFGVFIDIGLSDSGLVHISRLADRFIRDPHEVVGVGDVLKVWVVDVDKNRRRVSLTAIAPGTERQPRERQRQERPRQEQGPRQQRPPRPPRQPQGHGGAQHEQAGAPQPPGTGYGRQDQRPSRQHGGGRRDQRHGGRPAPQHPKTIDRPPTKPKKVKPITKAQEEGREPMRSFSDLVQLFDKKKEKPKEDETPSAES